MNLKPETADQIAFFEWLHYFYPKVWDVSFHVPNQRKCGWVYGKILKSMGVKSGISDVFIMCPNKFYHALVIEMKSTHEINRKRKEAQENFGKNLLANGYYFSYAFGLDEAMHITTEYLKNR
jgi:hypothetical protein